MASTDHDLQISQAPGRKSDRLIEYRSWQRHVRLLIGLSILFILGLLWFGTAMARSRAIRFGEAKVNRAGDIIKWTNNAEDVTGKWRDDMLATDIFQLVPPERRADVRRQFVRALDGPPYQMPRTTARTKYGMIAMEFRSEERRVG